MKLPNVEVVTIRTQTSLTISLPKIQIVFSYSRNITMNISIRMKPPAALTILRCQIKIAQTCSATFRLNYSVQKTTVYPHNWALKKALEWFPVELIFEKKLCPK
jgi:hypothetical protein